MFKLSIVTMVLSMMLSGSVLAEVPIERAITTTETPTVFLNQQTNTHALLAKQTQQAAAWGITSTQYQQYLHYTTIGPDRYNYDLTKLSPLMILALHTQDKAKRRELLKREIQIEIKEKGALLSALQEMSAIGHQLHPDTPVVNAPWVKYNRLEPGDVVQLFCAPDQGTCASVFNRLVQRVNAANGVRLDFFALNHPSQQAIQRFAANNNLNQASVLSHKITLNFGDQAFKRLEVAAGKSLSPPYAVIRRNRLQQPMGLGGLSVG